MTAITNVEVHSSLGQATVTITRRWSGQRGKVTDLPEDMREALAAWIDESRADR